MIIPDDIWNILTKSVKASKFKSGSSSIDSETRKKDTTVQIFELLVAETLNYYDDNSVWKVTQSTNDKGIDIYGISKRDITVPFSDHRFQELSLGQVKHTKNSYGYKKFKTDIHNLKDGWKNCFSYQDYSLRQFLLVLASNKENNIANLKSEMSADKIDNGLLDDAYVANIDIIDGNLLIKSWKLNFTYFKNILKHILSDEEIFAIESFINNIDSDWLDLSVDIENNDTKQYFVGEIFNYNITVINSLSYLNSNLYFRWFPEKESAMELIYPLSAVNPEKQGFPIEKSPSLRSKQIKEFNFEFRGLRAGTFNAGELVLCYGDGQELNRIDLGEVEFKCGIASKYLNEPKNSISYKKLKSIIQDQSPQKNSIYSFLFLGCGGIGKTTLIKEIMYLASANDFSCISISQNKDMIHEKTIIIELFYKLAFPDIVMEEREDTIIPELIFKLNLRGNKEWENNLRNYFSNQEDYSKEAVAECLSSLLLDASDYQKLFIWISDCHWGSHSSFFILSRTIEILYTRNEYIANDIVFIFEGRDHESLRDGKQLLSPVYWDSFISSSNNEIIYLPHWDHKMAKEFLLNLFPTFLNQMNERFIERVLEHSDGVPMHIMQMMNLLLEKEYIEIRDDGKIQVLKAYNDRLFSDNILEIIEERIDYYESKYPTYTDVLTIVAVINDSINPALNDWLVQALNINSHNKAIIQKSGFISDVERIRSSIVFHHEHYKTAFKRRTVRNQGLINDCIEFYENIVELNDIDRLNLIFLKNLLSLRDFKKIYDSCLSLLKDTASNSIKLSVLKFIIDLPEQVYCDVTPKYYINFEICELILRDGNWDSGLLYLDKVLEEKNYADVNNVEYLLMAYQEKANILADRLRFEEAVIVSNDGITLAEQAIANKSFHDHIDRLNLLKEKLQARLAVCKWFYGDYSAAKTIQQNCIIDARKRGDKYSENHVLYELETLNLHWEQKQPVINMGAIIELIDSREITSLDSERTLIEAQMIIGQTITACRENNKELIHKIKGDLINLLIGYKTKPHIYEEFLCHTLKAILSFYQENIEDTLFELTEAMRVSTLSNMLNLEWKGYVNLAQFLQYINDAGCVSYADSAKDIILDSLSHNKSVIETYKSMMMPVTEILERILQIEIQDMYPAKPCVNEEMLCVKTKDITFFVMN
jgi:hypothetical protein